MQGLAQTLCNISLTINVLDIEGMCYDCWTWTPRGQGHRHAFKIRAAALSYNSCQQQPRRGYAGYVSDVAQADKHHMWSPGQAL